MNKTTAIIITSIAALLCGCPGLLSILTGALAVVGTQVPEAMAGSSSTLEEVMLGAGILVCFGGILMVFPVIVGILSIGFASRSNPAINEQTPI